MNKKKHVIKKKQKMTRNLGYTFYNLQHLLGLVFLYVIVLHVLKQL